MSTQVSRVLLFGDDEGVALLLKVMPQRLVCGVVGASVRPAHHSRVERLAGEARVPLLVQPRAASPDYQRFVDAVIRLAPELLVVNSYSMLIQPELLRAARFGGINVHGALLPQYRGCNPIQWALINGEEETGVTLHALGAQFDTGDIIAQKRVPIRLEDTWVEVRDRVWQAAEALLIEQLPGLLKQEYARSPQAEPVARHYRRRKPEDGEFHWEQPVISIYNLVRALVSPHPGAFFVSHGKRTVLNEYLTLPQVVEMKYSPACGGQALESGRIRMVPLSAADAAEAITRVCGARGDAVFNNDVLCFSVQGDQEGSDGGVLRFHEIDYHGRSAAMTLVAASRMDEGSWTDVLRLSSTMAFDELHLKRLLVHDVENEEHLVRAGRLVGLCPEPGPTSRQASGAALSSVLFTRKAREY